jgi:uncharacterized membrane protein YkvA (DUF1232 family)
MPRKLFPELDSNVLEIFESRYRDIIAFKDTMNHLSMALEDFRKRIIEERNKNEFFDHQQANHLIDQSILLLQVCEQNQGKSFVPYVLAAIAYLVLTPDANDDFSSIDGLDDDALLLQRVISKFSLEQDLEKTRKELSKKEHMK